MEYTIDDAPRHRHRVSPKPRVHSRSAFRPTTRHSAATPRGGSSIGSSVTASTGLAQPMDICLSGGSLVFIYSESSAVHIGDRERIGGQTIVVTAVRLRSHGRRDAELRLPHPRAIACAPDRWSLVANTYNGALECIDMDRRGMRMWVSVLLRSLGISFSRRKA